MKNNKRNIVRLTESQLRQVIAESVKTILTESLDDYHLNLKDRYINNILNGKYDSKLFDDDFIYSLSDDVADFDDGEIYDAALERRKMISVDYAIKYGNHTYDDVDIDAENDFMYDYNGLRDSNPKLGDDYWNDHEMTQHPNYNKLFKKNGNMRSTNQIYKNLYKEYGWGGKADKKPLHRKGSWNRDLMDMDKK